METEREYHAEIEAKDLEYSVYFEEFSYLCPCGDRFRISKEELFAGGKVACCPSCGLMIKIVGEIERE